MPGDVRLQWSTRCAPHSSHIATLLFKTFACGSMAPRDFEPQSRFGLGHMSPTAEDLETGARDQVLGKWNARRNEVHLCISHESGWSRNLCRHAHQLDMARVAYATMPRIWP